eukprot:scaffold37950_cov33-Tisochrysis_lutea.AAC.3
MRTGVVIPSNSCTMRTETTGLDDLQHVRQGPTRIAACSLVRLARREGSPPCRLSRTCRQRERKMRRIPSSSEPPGCRLRSHPCRTRPPRTTRTASAHNRRIA